MASKFEVYYVDSKKSKITITPDRLTIKVSREVEIPLSAFRRMGETMLEVLEVPQSFRGSIFFSNSRSATRLYSNAKKTSFVWFYNFETLAFDIGKKQLGKKNRGDGNGTTI